VGDEKVVGRYPGERKTSYNAIYLHLPKVLIAIEGSGRDHAFLLACIWYRWLMPIFTRPPITFKAFPIYYDHSRHLYVYGNQTYNHEVEEAEIY
jgi:hypothetical protein